MRAISCKDVAQKLRKSTQKYYFNDPDKMSFGISDTHIIIATNSTAIVLCQYRALSYPRDILSQRIKRRLYENSAALIVSICLTYFFTPKGIYKIHKLSLKCCSWCLLT